MKTWYQHVVPLDREKHAELAIKTTLDASVAAGEAVLPLCLEEIPLAAAHYPIVFQVVDEAVVALAVVGLRGGQNLFVDADGRWTHGAYVPAVVRNYPFVLIEAGEGRELAGIEPDAPQFGADGQPLFVEGELTPVGKRHIEFSRAYRLGMAQAAAFGKALKESGVLEPQRADIVLPGGAERRRVEGFHTIDVKRFDAVSDEVFLAWRKAGWLSAVYHQIGAAAHWAHLSDLAAKAPAPESAEPEAESAKPDSEHLNGAAAPEDAST